VGGPYNCGTVQHMKRPPSTNTPGIRCLVAPHLPPPPTSARLRKPGAHSWRRRAEWPSAGLPAASYSSGSTGLLPHTPRVTYASRRRVFFRSPFCIKRLRHRPAIGLRVRHFYRSLTAFLPLTRRGLIVPSAFSVLTTASANECVFFSYLVKSVGDPTHPAHRLPDVTAGVASKVCHSLRNT